MTTDETHSTQPLGEWINESVTMNLLQCKKSTLYYLRKNKKIAFSRIGRKLFYSIQSILQLLNSNKRDAN